MTILSILERGKEASGDGTALVGGGDRLSYGALIDSVTGIARGLASRGLGKGVHAAVLSPNLPNAFCAALAIMASGCVYVPANGKASVAANVAVLNALDCVVLFYDSSMAEMVEAMRPGLTTVQMTIALDAESLDSLTAEGLAWAGTLPVPLLDDIAWLGQTGGTTGLPKGVQLNWRSIYAFLEKIALDLPEERPAMLVATPMTHAAGMLSLPMLMRGGRIVMLDKFDPVSFLRALENDRITTTFLPPTAIYRLLDLPGIGEHDYSSLRHFIFAAAPMAVPRLKQALSVFGPVMAQVYGQSECHTFVTVMRPQDFYDGPLSQGRLASDRRLAACGRPSLGTIIEIRDDEGLSVAVGQPGEICVMSDLAMAGYYRDPEATDQTIRGGFVHTGDIGILDEDGFLRIVDRKKDLIISGGVNVYPSDIEQVLGAHDAIAECAVVGLPHADWGEMVAAVVQLRPGRDANPEQLIAFVRERLGPINCPKLLRIWDDLPRSAVGKVLKNDIRQTLTAASG